MKRGPAILLLLFLFGFCNSGNAGVSLPKTTKTFSANGGKGSLVFVVSGGEPTEVAPTVTAGSDWLSLVSVTQPRLRKGAGRGQVVYTVGPCTSSLRTPREARISMGGLEFLVTQKGLPCKVKLSLSKTVIGADGGEGAFSVNAPPGCGWTAQPDSAATWIEITNGQVGEGTATVSFAVDSNEEKPRAAKINVTTNSDNPGKKLHTVSQKARPRESGGGGDGGRFVVLSSEQLIDDPSGDLYLESKGWKAAEIVSAYLSVVGDRVTAGVTVDNATDTPPGNEGFMGIQVAFDVNRDGSLGPGDVVFEGIVGVTGGRITTTRGELVPVDREGNPDIGNARGVDFSANGNTFVFGAPATWVNWGAAQTTPVSFRTWYYFGSIDGPLGQDYAPNGKDAWML